MILTIWLPHCKIEHQWIVNNVWKYILENERAVKWNRTVIKVLAAFRGKHASNDITTAYKKWMSTDCRWCLDFDLEYSMGHAPQILHDYSIGRLNGHKWWPQYHYYVLYTCVNRVSTVFVKAQYATQQWTTFHCSKIGYSTVSHFDMSLYATSQFCMQCLTGLSLSQLIASELVFKYQISFILWCNFWLSLKSNYVAFKFLPQCQKWNIEISHQ